MLDDDTILSMWGAEEDIYKYSQQNGADLRRDDFLRDAIIELLGIWGETWHSYRRLVEEVTKKLGVTTTKRELSNVMKGLKRDGLVSLEATWDLNGDMGICGSGYFLTKSGDIIYRQMRKKVLTRDKS